MVVMRSMAQTAENSGQQSKVPESSQKITDTVCYPDQVGAVISQALLIDVNTIHTQCFEPAHVNMPVSQVVTIFHNNWEHTYCDEQPASKNFIAHDDKMTQTSVK